MKTHTFLQLNIILILLVSILIPNITYAVEPTTAILERVKKVPEIQECFNNKKIDKKTELDKIDETLDKCKKDAVTKATAECETIKSDCETNELNSTNLCKSNYPVGGDRDVCIIRAGAEKQGCIKDKYELCTSQLKTKKEISDATCFDKANNDSNTIYETAENECNAKYSQDNQNKTTSPTGIDASKGPEIKPDIDKLLYKFSSGFTTDVTTTDYVASLPEEETPGSILGNIIYFSLVIANILAFISFIAAGLYMLISQGNEDEYGKAKKIIIYTLIALVICAAALALVTGVTRLNFFNP